MKVTINVPDWLYKELEKLAEIHSMNAEKYIPWMIERIMMGNIRQRRAR